VQKSASDYTDQLDPGNGSRDDIYVSGSIQRANCGVLAQIGRYGHVVGTFIVRPFSCELQTIVQVGNTKTKATASRRLDRAGFVSESLFLFLRSVHSNQDSPPRLDVPWYV
jgi:hypothetical protein